MVERNEHTALKPGHMAVVVWEVCLHRNRSSHQQTLTCIVLGYSVREELPLPDKPPFTVHLGNLSFDATSGDVQDFFSGCDCVNVRIIEDKLEMKPKGFGYAEFSSREGLIKALALSGSQFQGRNIRISVADPRKFVRDNSLSYT
jgi:translation initiation factor 4B